MKSAAGREMAVRVNRQIELGKVREHRLGEVLKIYPFLDRNWQLDLAEAAIAQALSSLASHKRREESESDFFAIVDILYARCDDPTEKLNEAQQKEIEVAATAAHQHLISVVNEVLRESHQLLSAMNEKSPLFMCANALHQIRTVYLEYASSYDLHTLIPRCLALSSALDAHRLGIESVEQVVKHIADVVDTCTTTGTRVLGQIDSGALVVKDGKITRAESSC
jgi:hypothetical protein